MRLVPRDLIFGVDLAAHHLFAADGRIFPAGKEIALLRDFERRRIRRAQRRDEEKCGNRSG
jgi:hypothetical protein